MAAKYEWFDRLNGKPPPLPPLVPTKRSTTYHKRRCGSLYFGNYRPTGSKTQPCATTVAAAAYSSGTSQSVGSNTKRSPPTASSLIQSEDSDTRHASSSTASA
ncbi:hypothetical protein D9757_007098 [Collybiopsis confluens]|uniref:Uncharacterized protein n=1 Tax=Collybiopsis confluens TaxID=2823264 RepID=A0A8H5M4B0_9AGAR|nr:hypothetical protein D9757_007098 [Collybiopsis confluens]